MPRAKCILKTCGVEIASKSRKCFGNQNHKICAGQKCLVFKENMRKTNYCLLCSKLIIEKGIEKLNELSSEIE